MNVVDLKDRILQSIELWADARIDDMVSGNPNLSIPSAYIKRASHNLIAKNKEKWSKQLDVLTIFVADEDGNVDTNTIFEDISKMLNGIKPTKYDLGLLHGTIGNGIVTIDLPDNLLTTLFFGSNKSIQFTADDLTELKSLIIEL